MGCDIHMYVEYKKKVNDNDVWVDGDYYKFNPYHKTDKEEPKLDRMELYGGRNYSLFSTLAGVRDYTDKMIPVSEPKGKPDDCNENIVSEFETWDGDGHSYSWLTLKEIKDYQDANPIIHYTGVISPQQALDFDINGTIPQSWCQGTNQEGWVRREWSEKNDVLIPLIEKMHARAKELMQYEWQDYDVKNDEKIRIVFFFDN